MKAIIPADDGWRVRTADGSSSAVLAWLVSDEDEPGGGVAVRPISARSITLAPGETLQVPCVDTSAGGY
jgi:hypothetical protein